VAKSPDEQAMNLENIRYHIAVTLLVLGSSGLPAALTVWGVTSFVHISGKYLDAAYLTTYVIFVCFGLWFYIPRMRGKT
jgi:hypothetical protein